MTWTTLHDACQCRNDNSVMDRCQTHPHEAQCLDDHESTPLHIACFHNLAIDGIRALLATYPQSCFARDIHGDTPLHVAVSSCNISNASSASAMALSPTSTTLDLVQLLVETCPDALSIANREGLMPLHAVCRYNPDQGGIISLLVEEYPDAAKHRIKMGDWVPRPFQSHKERKKSPTTQHQQNYHPQHVVGSPSRVVDLRYETLGIQTRDGSYPLHMVVAVPANPPTYNYCTLHVMDMILNAAPEVTHYTNKYGETPLHLALQASSSSSSTAVIELLLQKTEDFVLEWPERHHGNLPLHCAVQSGCCNLAIIVQLMTRYEHAVNIQNADGKVPHDLIQPDCHYAEALLDLLLVGEEADDKEDVQYNEQEVESNASDNDPLW